MHMITKVPNKPTVNARRSKVGKKRRKAAAAREPNRRMDGRRYR